MNVMNLDPKKLRACGQRLPTLLRNVSGRVLPSRPNMDPSKTTAAILLLLFASAGTTGCDKVKGMTSPTGIAECKAYDDYVEKCLASGKLKMTTGVKVPRDVLFKNFANYMGKGDVSGFKAECVEQHEDAKKECGDL